MVSVHFSGHLRIVLIMALSTFVDTCTSCLFYVLSAFVDACECSLIMALSTFVDTCAVAGILIIADKRKIREDREAKPRFEILCGRVKRK